MDHVFCVQLGLIKQFAYNYNPNKRQYTFMTIYPNGRYTSRVMDLRGRTVERSVNGKVTHKSLWINNNRERIEVDAQGNETISHYDQWGNRLKSVYADGTVETWQYQAGTNWMTQHTAANGVITTYDYNANGQVTEMVEAKGTAQQRTTTCTYNQYGERTSTTVSPPRRTTNSQILNDSG